MHPRLLPFFCLLLTITMSAASAPAQSNWKSFTSENGQALEYAVVLPQDYDASRPYPTLLALPPGPQTRAMVERGLELYWETEASKRGWIVISPAAQGGKLFFQGSEEIIPSFLQHILGQYKVETGRFHLAGPSNGGRSAFRLACESPQTYLSLIALPGFPSGDKDQENLPGIASLPVHLFVGGDDTQWVQAMESVRDQLQDLGSTRVHWNRLEGEGHVPRSLGGAQLFDILESEHKEIRKQVEEQRRVNAVLTDFHLAASQADGDRYFRHFSPGGIFLGTDGTERWTVKDFRAYAKPHFDQGNGWTYVAVERNISVARGGHTAWFDERLTNEKYGEVRGSGVLQKQGEHWRIAQYNLTFTVPNELSSTLVELIRNQ